MRAGGTGAVAIVLVALAGGPVRAQSGAPIVVPPPPPIVATPANTPPAPPPLTAAPPGLAVTPVPQAPLPQAPLPQAPVTPPAGAANADTGAGAAAPPAPPADSWVPGSTAQLGVLNEVDGSVTQVRIPVGGQAGIGDLQVSVLACLRRPPEQIPDAAAFVSVQASPNAAADAAAAAPSAVANAPLQAPDAADDAAAAGVANPDPSSAGAPSTVAPSTVAPSTVAPSTGASSTAAPSIGASGGAASYRGWMVRSTPGAMVIGDASETFRVIDCS